LLALGLSIVARRRAALVLWRAGVRGTGRDAAAVGRRIRLYPRRLRPAARFPLLLELVRDRQAGIDRHRRHRRRGRARCAAALWAYDGWNDLNMVGEEVKDPGRSIPIALILGVAIVGVLYALMNAGIQYVLPAAQLAAAKSPAAEMMKVFLGPVGAAVITAG